MLRQHRKRHRLTADRLNKLIVMLSHPRIAIDGRSLEGEPTGVGTYTSNLLEQLLLLDPDLDILLITDRVLSERRWSGGERVQVVNTVLPWHNNFFWMNLALRKQIGKRRCALFHSPGYTLPLSLPVPSVVTIHDVSYAACPEWYPYNKGLLRTAWYRLSARRADCILTVSEFSRREIVRVYGIPDEKVRVIPQGVDPRRFRKINQEALFADLRQRYGLHGDFLLYVGDIHRRRNVERLIEALGVIRESEAAFSELKLVVIGRTLEPLTHTGERARLKLGPSVRMLGYIPAEDLPLFYSRARAFVFPSFYEGFGLGVLEAMACGCPVIIGKGTACEEVAGEAAISVDPGDTASIVQATASVLRNSMFAAQHAEAGLKRSEKFRWKTTAEMTRSVYESLLRPHPP